MSQQHLEKDKYLTSWEALGETPLRTKSSLQRGGALPSPDIKAAPPFQGCRPRHLGGGPPG